MVDFSAAFQGTYKARVYLTRFYAETTEYLGLAYSTTWQRQPQHRMTQKLYDPVERRSAILVPVTLDNYWDVWARSTGNVLNITEYRGKAKYPAGTIEMRDALGNTFFNISEKSLNNNGVSTFRGTAPDPDAADSPLEVGNLVVRLNGSYKQIYKLGFTFTSLLTTTDLFQKTPFYAWYQRGDALENWDPNPQDDMTNDDANIISQYLAELVPLEALNAVNAATPRQDSPYDVITITDAMYIAQALRVPPLRDEYFNWINYSPGGASSGSATVEIGSLALNRGTTTRIPITLRNIQSSMGVGAYDLKITYNPALIRITGVDVGEAPFGKPASFKIDNNKGQVLVNGFHATSPGATKDTVLAYLVAEPATAATTSATINVAVTTLADVIGNDMASKAFTGTVTAR